MSRPSWCFVCCSRHRGRRDRAARRVVPFVGVGRDPPTDFEPVRHLDRVVAERFDNALGFLETACRSPRRRRRLTVTGRARRASQPLLGLARLADGNCREDLARLQGTRRSRRTLIGGSRADFRRSAAGVAAARSAARQLYDRELAAAVARACCTMPAVRRGHCATGQHLWLRDPGDALLPTRPLHVPAMPSVLSRRSRCRSCCGARRPTHRTGSPPWRGDRPIDGIWS